MPRNEADDVEVLSSVSPHPSRRGVTPSPPREYRADFYEVQGKVSGGSKPPPYGGEWSLCADGYVGRQNSDPNNPSPPTAELPLHKGAFGTPRRRPLQGEMDFVQTVM